MGGGHNSHASGQPKRRAVQSNSRSSAYKACENFTTDSCTFALKTDITTYSTALPTQSELVKVRCPIVVLRGGGLGDVGSAARLENRALLPNL